MFQIKKIENKQPEIKQCRGAQCGILPKHPFRMMLCGASGSGKTNFLLNLLTRKEMYKDYFTDMYIISPTAGNLDQTYNILGLDESNYFVPTIEILSTIMEIQQEKMDKVGGNKNKCKTLVIIDDCVSYDKFMNSHEFLTYCIMGRHYGLSIIMTTQAYHRVPKSCRLQCSCICYFRGSQKECKVLTDDFCAPGLSNREFLKKINYATEDRYEFMFIDLNRSIEDGRYRKNLTEKLI